MDRRTFLRAGGLLGVGLGVSSWVQAKTALHLNCTTGPKRTLRFYNLHTDEKLESTYWADGCYVPQALEGINHILRDFRRNEAIAIDPGLLDQAYLLQQQLGSEGVIEIISGYRSPATNQMLRNNGGGGVARRSLHMEGRALDLRLSDSRLSDVHRAALALKLGGVGYYPGSNFVHIDTGQVRQWRG